MLTAELTDLVPSRTGGRSASRMCWASDVIVFWDCTSSMRTANSSPPSRAAVSDGPQAPDQRRRHPAQKVVPLAMTKTVVHRLEVVQIEEEDRQVRPAPLQACQGVVEAVLEQRLVGEPGQRIVEGPVRQLLLQALVIGDVAEAPHPARQSCRRPAGDGIGARRRGHRELEGVEALHLRLGEELLDLGQECLGMGHVAQDEVERGRRVTGGEDVLGELPDLGEPAVEAGDLPRRVDHQDAVRRGVQGRGEERERLTEFEFGAHLRGGVVGGDHEALDGRVVQQVHDAQFERDDAAALVAQHPDPGGDRLSRCRPCARRGEGGVKSGPIALRDDVGQGSVLHQLGVVSEETRHRARDRLEDPFGRHQHDHRGSVVHE